MRSMKTSRKFLAALAVSASIGSMIAGASGPASAAGSGLELVSKYSAISSSHAKSVTAMCPSGKKVVGAGGEELGPNGSKVPLEDITPLPNLSGVNVVATESFGGLNQNWELQAFAICANPLPGQQLVSHESVIDSTPAKSAVVFCPSGKSVVGAGGQVNVGQSGPVVLDEITPLPNLSGVNVVGAETPAGTTNNWTVKAYAICV